MGHPITVFWKVPKLSTLYVVVVSPVCACTPRMHPGKLRFDHVTPKSRLKSAKYNKSNVFLWHTELKRKYRFSEIKTTYVLSHWNNFRQIYTYDLHGFSQGKTWRVKIAVYWLWFCWGIGRNIAWCLEQFYATDAQVSIQHFFKQISNTAFFQTDNQL